jgi:hypothetical protein
MISINRASSYSGVVRNRQSKLVVKVGKSKNTDFGIAIGNTARTAARVDVGLPDVSFEELGLSP